MRNYTSFFKGEKVIFNNPIGEKREVIFHEITGSKKRNGFLVAYCDVEDIDKDLLCVWADLLSAAPEVPLTAEEQKAILKLTELQKEVFCDFILDTYVHAADYYDGWDKSHFVACIFAGPNAHRYALKFALTGKII